MASLPRRENRGSRINKLIGEAAEADEAFWGHEVWNEDEDEDYSSEAEEEDVVDSDFDEDEAPDEAVHDGEVELKRREKPTRTPKILHQRPPRSTPRTGAPSRPPVTSTPSVPAAPVEPMAVRSSTVQKRFMSQELQQKYTEEARNMHEKVAKVVVRMTQEQLLKEAVLTEVQNTASLNRLERLEEEKRLVDEIMPKAKYTGPMVRYHSALGKPKLITFLNVDNFPTVFKRPKHENAAR